MNDHDSRRKRELTELARLLPVPGGRDLPAGRQQILKEHLMTEFRRPDAPGQASQLPAPGRRGKRPWRLAAVAGAGVLAVALTVAAVAVANARAPHARPSAAPSGPPSTPATAAALLVKIANAAAGQPSPAVRNSEFMYIRSRVAYQVDTIVNGHETSTMEKPHERQVWLPVANLCVTGLLIEDGSRTLLSPFPVVNGKVERSVPKGEPQPDIKCPSEGHLGDATYRLLQSLPTSPAALLTYLKAGKKWTNDPPSTEIGDLIREAIIPPAVAAALYRVAALLPGATLVPDVTNAVGRHGIGIAWTSPDGRYRNVWIFDRASLQYIGERDYNVRTGVVNGESAILQRAFVGQAGQLP